jgi:hypothetical protein
MMMMNVLVSKNRPASSFSEKSAIVYTSPVVSLFAVKIWSNPIIKR